MSRILTGIQSTGTPHLGNLLGAIVPAIEMANDPKNDSFLFIADMHSLTQIKNAELLRANTYSVAATWLAFGLDIERVVFYRQSDVPQTAELSWYLSCFFPFQRLTLAHSFKDKADRLEDVNAARSFVHNRTLNVVDCLDLCFSTQSWKPHITGTSEPELVLTGGPRRSRGYPSNMPNWVA